MYALDTKKGENTTNCTSDHSVAKWIVMYQQKQLQNELSAVQIVWLGGCSMCATQFHSINIEL